MQEWIKDYNITTTTITIPNKGFLFQLKPLRLQLKPLQYINGSLEILSSIKLGHETKSLSNFPTILAFHNKDKE